jgi:hypothetical protein
VGEFTSKIRNGRVCRSLIAVLVAYAVAAQSLLIVLGGFTLPAAAQEAAPAFAICLHDAQADAGGAPALPASHPDHGCTHCIFCFAGSHHAVIGAAVAAVHRVDVEIVVARWVAGKSPRPGVAAYLIPHPRGPPPGV